MTLDEIIMWSLHFTLWICIFVVAIHYRDKIATKLLIAALVVRHIRKAVSKAFRDEYAEKHAEFIEKKRQHIRKARNRKIERLEHKKTILREKCLHLRAEAIDDMLAEGREIKKNDPAPLQQCRTCEDVRLNTIFLVYSNTNKPKSQDKG